MWPPKPGYFRLALVRGGWPAPAQIIFHADGQWQAVIDGEPGLITPDPVQAGVDRVWHAGRFSNASEYDYLNALREWARANQPDHPAADARRAVNPALLRPLAH